MKKIYIVNILILSVIIINANEKCNVCQNNGVACVNKTSYQLCFGGSKASIRQTFKCMDGMECTDLPNICFQSGGWTPSCGDLSKCGVCNSNRVFACTSRTTFEFCFGAKTPMDVKGKCPRGYVCDLTSDFICVPHTNGIEPSCDKIAIFD